MGTQLLLRCAAAAALALAVAACGGDDDTSGDGAASTTTASNTTASNTSSDAGVDSGGDDTGGDDTGGGDMEAPTFRDIRVSVSGEFGDEFDLNDEDGELLLPVPVPVEVTVFGQDDTTAPGDLTVELIEEGSGVAIALSDENFRNGLWRLTAPLGPGSVTRVRVTDEAGNAATSSAALVVPGLDQTILGRWKRPVFDRELQVLSQIYVEYTADGAWSREDVDLAGTWAIAEGVATVAETELPAELSRAPVQTTALVHVDAFYLSLAPYERVEGEGEGARGVWRQTRAEAAEAASGEFGEPVEVVTELELSEDDTWAETVTIDGEASTSSGTWRIEINEDYIESLGDFLVREVEVIDGAPVAEAETRIELFDIRGGRLLRSPFVRADE